MKNKTYKHSILILLLFLGFTSCETLDLDINENPSSLTTESADPDFILNGIQFQFVTQNITLSEISSGMIRHTGLFGTYASAAGADTMDGPWQNTYAITNNLNLLEVLAETNDLSTEVAVGQILEAWSYINLVDYIGEAVYSEAVNPDFPTPNLDSGESIYDAMYLQLDSAIATLSQTSSSLNSDLFYDGDLTKWIKAANTLKLKMYVQSKLVNNGNDVVTAINSIINSGNYIKDSSDDFAVQFGSNALNPDTRHHWYGAAYVSDAGNVYMSNDFMYKLKDEKGFEDPRLKYYIYRQDTSDPTGSLLPCSGDSSFDYCYIGGGYWGRDHGDDEGIPNDGNQRSTYGVYPAGGAYDDGSSNTTTTSSSDLGGAGIFPIWLSSFSKLLLAESSLASPSGLGTNGDTVTYLTEAIEDSFSKVEGFSGEDMDATSKSDYITYITDEYNNTTSNSEKLNIIIREYYIAMWGNSIEAYNNYRRTGMPTLQGSVIAGTDFPRSYFLPASELNSNDNPNLTQKALTDQVFWDVNPAGFIN